MVSGQVFTGRLGLVESQQVVHAHELIAEPSQRVQECAEPVVEVVASPSRACAGVHEQQETVQSIRVSAFTRENRRDDVLCRNEVRVTIGHVIGVRPAAGRHVDKRQAGLLGPACNLLGMVLVRRKESADVAWWNPVGCKGMQVGLKVGLKLQPRNQQPRRVLPARVEQVGVGMRSDQVPLVAQASDNRSKRGISEEPPGEEERCLDVSISERIEDGPRSFRIEVGGEDERNLFFSSLGPRMIAP